MNIEQPFNIEELFTAISSVVKNNALDNQEAIELAISEMKQAVGKPSFSEKYKTFMQTVANHITVLGPFLPQLAMLLP